jgi:hypothetical protein
MSNDTALRNQLAKLLDSSEAHADFDAAVKGLPAELQGAIPPGLQHSPWQLLEHMRIAQHDILDFCLNANYQEMKWPDDYWPAPEPPTPTAWEESLAAYRRDCEAMKELVRDPQRDLFATIPHGAGQTYLREALLVADHAAYHVGQLVLVRRLLGAWK